MIFAGGNVYKEEVGLRSLIGHTNQRAYEASTGTDDCAVGYGVQPIDKWCKPLDQLGITIPEFIKCPGLLLKYG